MKNSQVAKLMTALSLSFLVMACGRPATEEECKEILRRTAELEMKGRLGNKELIKSELAAIEKSMRPQMMKKCVGKRITDEAMACVREAKTADEVSSECFR
jgi:hypothetical protein